jgi:peptidoglycan/LPS O-acetylase OafA/YrhL
VDPSDDERPSLPRFVTGGSYDPPPMARWKAFAWLVFGAIGTPVALKSFGATLDSYGALPALFLVPACVFGALAWMLPPKHSTSRRWAALAFLSTFLSAGVGIVWLAPAPETTQGIPWLAVVIALVLAVILAVEWFRLLWHPRTADVREGSSRPWRLLVWLAIIVLSVMVLK